MTRSFRLALALTLAACSGPAAPLITISPERATLRPGESVDFVASTTRTATAAELSAPGTIADVPFTITLRWQPPLGSVAAPGVPSYLTLEDTRGAVLAQRENTATRAARCELDAVARVVRCEWRGTMRLEERAPPSTQGHIYALAAQVQRGTARASIELAHTSTLPPDAGMPDGGPCPASRCLNGMLDPFACMCFCWDGWTGAACDRPISTVETLIGGVEGFADGERADARLSSPRGLAIGLDGGVVIADTGNRAVRVLDPLSGVLTTLAGAPDRERADGPLESAGFDAPLDVAVASDGAIYVVDGDVGRGATLRRIGDGEVRTVVTGGLPLDGLTAIHWHEGTLYAAQTSTITSIDLASGEVTRVAGNPLGSGGVILDGSVESAELDSVGDVMTVDIVSALVVTDGALRDRGAVRAILGAEVTTRMGRVDDGRGWVGMGPLGQPFAIVSIGGTRAVVSESGAHRVRLVDLGTGLAEDLAGPPWMGPDDVLGERGFADGLGPDARFDAPRGLALSADTGIVYVADEGNHAVRAIYL